MELQRMLNIDLDCRIKQLVVSAVDGGAVYGKVFKINENGK